MGDENDFVVILNDDIVFLVKNMIGSSEEKATKIAIEKFKKNIRYDKFLWEKAKRAGDKGILKDFDWDRAMKVSSTSCLKITNYVNGR